jgi:histidine triad (HIT) family protein
MYEENNVFAKIIKGEIPSKKVYEDDEILAFYDINPRARIHVLVIPKIACKDFSDFVQKADDKTISSFFIKVNQVATEVLKLTDFKILTNKGKGAGQEVFHFHIHILAN